MMQRFNCWPGLVRLMLALGLLAAGAQAAANCAISNSSAIISFGTLTIARDAPIGMPIGPAMTSTVSVNCSLNTGSYGSTDSYYLQIFPSLAMSAIPNVWATGMAGIGVQVVNVTSGAANYTWSSGTAKSDFAPAVPGGAESQYIATFTIQYQLVKTAAQVTAGGALTVPQMFYLMSHDAPNNQDSGQMAATGIGNTTITTATCSVATNPINVTLPALPASQLTAVGATGGDTHFQIELQCGAGATVYVTLTDASTPGNTTNQLTLASGSSAGGVKLRILNASGAAVNFGPDSAELGNQNQWYVGNSAGVSGIPLTVQYISTGTVRPGTVQGAATFTLSYQ